MQIMLLLGIVFATMAVAFALQNNVPVTVTFAVWRFDSTIAMVLLVALGLGVIIASLLTTPAVIRGRWVESRLRRQVVALEADKNSLTQRSLDLEAKLDRLHPEALPIVDEPKPYVGLKSLMLGGADPNPER